MWVYIAVREWNDQIIFLRQIIEGAADKSYGIQVARLAGLPDSIIQSAKDILVTLEGGVSSEAPPDQPPPKRNPPEKDGTVEEPDDEDPQMLLFG